jgi:hypothetical protein
VFDVKRLAFLRGVHNLCVPLVVRIVTHTVERPALWVLRRLGLEQRAGGFACAAAVPRWACVECTLFAGLRGERICTHEVRLERMDEDRLGLGLGARAIR